MERDASSSQTYGQGKEGSTKSNTFSEWEDETKEDNSRYHLGPEDKGTSTSSVRPQGSRDTDPPPRQSIHLRVPRRTGLDLWRTRDCGSDVQGSVLVLLRTTVNRNVTLHRVAVGND